MLLRELLVAYAGTFKMGAETKSNDSGKNFGFWRPWLDATGKNCFSSN